jgi:hypothetical protein
VRALCSVSEGFVREVTMLPGEGFVREVTMLPSEGFVQGGDDSARRRQTARWRRKRTGFRAAIVGC